jgi:hypothetical protein
MTRKFNNPSTANKKQGNQSHASTGQNKNIYKDNKEHKKDNNKKQQQSKPLFPLPVQTTAPINPAPVKPVSEAAKANLAKLASINKLMIGKSSTSQ